ncbi:S-layer homology domain-containing protein [Paenibacillus tarimensis]
MSKAKRARLPVILALAAVTAFTAVLPAGVYAEKAVQNSEIGEWESSVSGSASEPATSGLAEEESPVNAEINKDKAISLSKQYVSIPDDYTLQNASFSSETLVNGKRTLWNLSFVKRVNNKYVGEIYTRIDASSGQLIGFSSYIDDPTRKSAYPPKVSREQAQEMALAFIGQVNPGYKDQLRYNPDYGVEFRPPLNEEVTYSIQYNRVVNGVAYMDNYIDIRIDGEGHIMQYDVRWDETIEFEAAKAGITEEEAVRQFRDEAVLELVYTMPYDSKNKSEPILRYELAPFMLDAVNGGRWMVGDTVNPAAGADSKPVSESPLGTKSAGDKNLSAEESAKLVSEAFAIVKDADLKESSYSEYTDPATGITSSIWNLGWETDSGNEKSSYNIWASVDSRTGEIRSYYAYPSSGTGERQSEGETYEQARTKAIELVKNLLPGYAHELYLTMDDASRYEGKKPEEIGSYGFSFQRKVNGARVEYESVHIGIDAFTGDVQNYHAELSGFDYPEEAPEVIERDKALDAFMEYYKAELTYVIPMYWMDGPIPVEKYNLLVASGEIPPGMPADGTKDTKAKLVYRLVQRPLDEQVVLDALTGQWRERSTGDPTELIKPQAADINGHWAERELALMVAYKALDLEEGNVRPKAIVTRGELIKMLVLAMNSGRRPIPYAKESATFNDVAADSSYFVYVESAVEQNLIDRGDGSFDPDGKVDREEMAELIVRALGYNTLAEYEELFNVPFKDAAAIEKKGQAAIVAGLKIMNPDTQGNFRPDRQVTRAEASVAFFRFLKARADLQEAPLRN